MPEGAFLLQEEIRYSTRVCAAMDSGKKAASTAEHNTDDMARRTIEEVTNSEFQSRWLLAWGTVLFV